LHDPAKVSFIIDGFNLYHSVRKAEQDLNRSTKWLNIKALCQSYLSTIGRHFNVYAVLEKIYYFSAIAYHMQSSDPDVPKRHKLYLRCLEDSGIIIHLSRFKQKQVLCLNCGQKFIKHEEKETDVAIAMKVAELCINDKSDIIVLVTGDTDLAPCIEFVKKYYPEKRIVFAFPYKRTNTQLQQMADFSFRIRAQQYAKYQFSDPYTLSNGKQIKKPLSW